MMNEAHWQVPFANRATGEGKKKQTPSHRANRAPKSTNLTAKQAAVGQQRRCQGPSSPKQGCVQLQHRGEPLTPQSATHS